MSKQKQYSPKYQLWYDGGKMGYPWYIDSLLLRLAAANTLIPES
jgi:hypothetical protein